MASTRSWLDPAAPGRAALMRPGVLLPVLAAAAALAVPRGHAGPTGPGAPAAAEAERGWTLHVDNDLFAFTDTDRDYTAGAAFTLGGEAADAHALSLARPLEWADRVSGFGRLAPDAALAGRALELGLLLFTPQDLDTPLPQTDDRPFANLLYVSSSTLRHDAARGVALQSSLTLGILGLPLGEALHRRAHRLFGGIEPLGYAHQISDGGEPTARYAVSRYALLADGIYAGRPYSLRFGAGGSLGYLTEANAELALRWGRTETEWWSALPVSTEYAGHPPVRGPRRAARPGRPELLIDAGIKLRARPYNSFLQGQWRDSAITYSTSEVEPWLLEVWLGLTTVLANDLSVSYAVRYQSGELGTGTGARGSSWASIGIAHRF